MLLGSFGDERGGRITAIGTLYDGPQLARGLNCFWDGGGESRSGALSEMVFSTNYISQLQSGAFPSLYVG